MNTKLQPEITTGIQDGDLQIKPFTFSDITVEIVPVTQKGQNIIGRFVDSITVVKSSVIR